MVRRQVLGWLLAFGLVLPMGAAAQEAWMRPLAESAGVIQQLDFGQRTMIIDGMRYQVAPDVKVEIAGSFGAFTLLEPDMRIAFEFRRVSETERVVTLVRELPAEAELDKA